MRLLPRFVICLALLPGCKTDPTDPDDEGGEVEAQLVPEDEFAVTAAETLCAQLFACGCGDSPLTVETEPLPWASEAECVAEKQPSFQAFLDNRLTDGAVYSSECGGEYIANYLRLDCQTQYDFLVDGGQFVDPLLCPLGTHERAVGEACQPYSQYIDDCGVGKACSENTYTCIEVGEVPVQNGGICEIDYTRLPCAAGLYCIYNEDGTNTCQAAAKVGDPCPNYTCVGADLTCDYNNTMTCIPAAGVGESCESSSCAAGLYCDGGQMFTCQEQFEYGHGCANDSVCAAGGQCIGSICTPPSPAICSV